MAPVKKLKALILFITTYNIIFYEVQLNIKFLKTVSAANPTNPLIRCLGEGMRVNQLKDRSI